MSDAKQQLPPSVVEHAALARTKFPNVRILRAVDERTGATWGRPIWDDVQAEMDSRRGGGHGR